MRLLRPRQVAKETGLGYHYVLSLMASGVLPAVRLPGRAFDLIDAADVERVISSAKSGTDGGTKLLHEERKLQSSPAPEKRCRNRLKSGQFDGKPKWVKEFTRA